MNHGPFVKSLIPLLRSRRLRPEWPSCRPTPSLGEETTDRRTDKATFTSTGEAGASAIYLRDGGTLYLKNPEIHGYGEMNPGGSAE